MNGKKKSRAMAGTNATAQTKDCTDDHTRLARGIATPPARVRGQEGGLVHITRLLPDSVYSERARRWLRTTSANSWTPSHRR